MQKARQIMAFVMLSISVACNTKIPFISQTALAGDTIEASTLADVRARRIPEDNGVADLLCKLVRLMQSDISRAMIGFSLFSAGVGAFFGKLTAAWFLSFALGAAVFFGSISMLEFFAPYSDVSAGCKCKQFTTIGLNNNGSRILIPTKLDKDCNRLDHPTDPADTPV